MSKKASTMISSKMAAKMLVMVSDCGGLPLLASIFIKSIVYYARTRCSKKWPFHCQIIRPARQVSKPAFVEIPYLVAIIIIIYGLLHLI